MLPKKPKMLPKKRKMLPNRVTLKDGATELACKIGAANAAPGSARLPIFALWRKLRRPNDFFSFSCISVVSHGVTFKLIEVRRSVAVSSNQADAANLILVGWV